MTRLITQLTSSPWVFVVIGIVVAVVIWMIGVGIYIVLGLCTGPQARQKVHGGGR